MQPSHPIIGPLAGARGSVDGTEPRTAVSGYQNFFSSTSELFKFIDERLDALLGVDLGKALLFGRRGDHLA